MTRPSIGAAIFLALFGLPFAAFGLFFAFASSRAGSNMPGWIGVAFGLFFALIGFGLMAAAVFGYGKMKEQAAVEAANPDKPWLWKKDWAAGRANGGDPKANITIWVFTAFWDFISIFLAAVVLPKLLVQGDLRALLVLIFPLAGVFITAFAVRGTLKTLRYGRTSFWFDTVPFSPGGKVKGVIRLKLATATPHGVDVRLSCKRRIVTGSGKNQSTNEMVLWQDEKNIPAQAVMLGLMDAEVPVEFTIPPDLYETCEENSRDRVFWQLHAQADVPGVDFSDNYELPVFRTQASAAAAGHGESFGSSFDQGFAPSAKSEVAAPAPAVTSIVHTEDEQGTSFYFPPLRNRSQAFGAVVFATIWTAVVYFLWAHEGVPWIFRIVLSLFEVLVVYMVLQAVFGSALLRVKEGALELRSAILGFGTLRRIPFGDVASISPLSQGQAGTSGEVRYGIRVRVADGRSFNLVQSSLSQGEARWVVSTIERAMGREQDTRVEFLSIYGAPPQRALSTSSAGTGVNTPLKFAKTPRKIGLIGFLVWLLIAGSMFYRVFSNKPASRKGNQAPAETSSTALKGPLTDADVDRISGLPIQAQAEELLERSIQHDERALELFESKIEDWTSEVRLTDRMKQLEWRSRFSKDLRVREANVDLNLATEGWHRNTEAVNLLMQRAESDPQYRPSAFYFLGMEGSRGVESERVFEKLQQVALSDPNPQVRQWAIEGLRFFRSDEALEVMYKAFTTDPNFNVRDRAGCNLSDCGIFTRAQRMHYVPRLIELAGDSSLNGQMRSWVFMALTGITDASVPPNVEAWRKWWEEHGVEKTEAFNQLAWYEVRGDE